MYMWMSSHIPRRPRNGRPTPCQPDGPNGADPGKKEETWPRRAQQHHHHTTPTFHRPNGGSEMALAICGGPRTKTNKQTNKQTKQKKVVRGLYIHRDDRTLQTRQVRRATRPGRGTAEILRHPNACLSVVSRACHKCVMRVISVMCVMRVISVVSRGRSVCTTARLPADCTFSTQSAAPPPAVASDIPFQAPLRSLPLPQRGAAGARSCNGLSCGRCG